MELTYYYAYSHCERPLGLGIVWMLSISIPGPILLIDPKFQFQYWLFYGRQATLQKEIHT